jgi:ABC-type branched-subunit amino acid transport system permease subunit
MEGGIRGILLDLMTLAIVLALITLLTLANKLFDKSEAEEILKAIEEVQRLAESLGLDASDYGLDSGYGG